MKRAVVFMFFVLCGLNILNAQNVLSGYRGFWERNRSIRIFNLVDFYPDRLPFLRNEIYARYGRPFVNQIYRDYFRAQNWYEERSNFSDSWLSQNDRDNAALILSLEQSVKSIDDIIPLVLRNIEYTGGEAVLTFTSRQELVWSDRRVDFGVYSMNWSSRQTLPWAVMGDWILVYQDSYRDFEVAAYRLDHSSRRIVSSDTGTVEWDAMVKLLRSQGRPVPK
jgi:hypothetical protein